MSEDMKPMKDWLETWYIKESSRNIQRLRFAFFLRWVNKTPKQLVEEFEQKQARDLILKFQNYLKNDFVLLKGRRKGETGMLDNGIRAHVNAVRAFYTSQCEQIKGLRKKIVAVQKAKGEHVFSVNDLQKIWHIADTRDKAIISVGASLGWDASAFLNMNREYFESLIKRARETEEEFIKFEWQREKTGAEQYGILTPCAIDSLERWINHKDSKKKSGLWNGLTPDGLNKVLKRLTKEANITTTGRIRWHLLRKWLMNTLSLSGFNNWEVKLVLGKAIPTTDLTYLQTIKQTAFEKYKKVYPQNMSLVSYSNDVRKFSNLNEKFIELAKLLKEIVETPLPQLQKGQVGRPKLEPIKRTQAYTTVKEGSTRLEEIKKKLDQLIKT